MGNIITSPPNKIKSRTAPLRHGLDVFDDEAFLSGDLFVRANKSDCRTRVRFRDARCEPPSDCKVQTLSQSLQFCPQDRRRPRSGFAKARNEISPRITDAATQTHRPALCRKGRIDVNLPAVFLGGRPVSIIRQLGLVLLKIVESQRVS